MKKVFVALVLCIWAGVAHAQYGTLGVATGCTLSGCTLTGPLAIVDGTANTTPLAISGASITGSATTSPGITITGTANTSGVIDGEALFANITNTGVGAGSLLVDLQVGGVSKFSVNTTGALIASSSVQTSGAYSFGNGSQLTSSASGVFRFENNGSTNTFNLTAPCATATPCMQLGLANSATPLNQVIQVAGSRSGTDTNIGGANLTVTSGNGTGTGTPSNILFQVPVGGSTGTTAQTQTTALEISGANSGSSPTILMPGMANTATTSALCYNTSTGLITYDGTLGTCTVSTMRVKHDIVPLQSDILLAGVMKMQPDSFFYNANMNTPGQQLGLMAEDLEKIDPRLVSYDDTGKPNAIRYLGPMFAYLTGAIKAQQAEINALKQRLP